MVNIYQNCYELIHNYIFGGATLTSNTELITIALASAASIFCFAVPFMVVWKVIKMIVG